MECCSAYLSCVLLSFLDEQMQRVVELGLFDIIVGTHSERVEAVQLEVVD